MFINIIILLLWLNLMLNGLIREVWYTFPKINGLFIYWTNIIKFNIEKAHFSLGIARRILRLVLQLPNREAQGISARPLPCTDRCTDKMDLKAGADCCG